MSKDDERVSPLDVSDQLERDLQVLNKRSRQAMLSGDRTPREVMIEHYTAVRDHVDDALQLLKGEEKAT